MLLGRRLEVADAFVEYRQGEKRPLYGEVVTTAPATLTIGTPTPTLTLYDSLGAIVSGFNGISVTDWDVPPAATVKAWYDLDTVTPAVLAVGQYVLVFKIATTGSDGLARKHEPSVQIWVRAANS